MAGQTYLRAMASFRWKGRSADGHELSGNLDAGSKEEVLERLRGVPGRRRRRCRPYDSPGRVGRPRHSRLVHVEDYDDIRGFLAGSRRATPRTNNSFVKPVSD